MTEAEPTPKVVEAQTPVVTNELKKPELIDRVVALSGAKKKDAKPIVEAMLAVMGQAVSDGEQLNLQPFGRLKVAKQKDLPNGQALTLKLRRSGPALAETAPLEGAAENGAASASEGLAEPGTDG